MISSFLTCTKEDQWIDKYLDLPEYIPSQNSRKLPKRSALQTDFDLLEHCKVAVATWTQKSRKIYVQAMSFT